MPNINLIAVRREEKKRLERTTRQLFFGVAGSLSVLVGLALYLGAQRLDSTGSLREIEAEMQKLQPKLDEMARIQKETAELEPRVETLRDAKAGTQKWRAILQVVSAAMPPQTWLAGMSASGSGDDTTINLTGISGSQTLVGETMTRLGAHPLFDRVELRFTQAAQPDPAHPMNAPKVNFEINAHLRPSNAKPADPKAGGAPAEGQKAASRMIRKVDAHNA